MKLIFSHALLDASNTYSGEIARALGMHEWVPAPVASTTPEITDMQHYAVRHVDDAVEFEVSDALVLRLLRAYVRFAGVIAPIIVALRRLREALVDECEAINTMVNERRIK